EPSPAPRQERIERQERPERIEPAPSYQAPRPSEPAQSFAPRRIEPATPANVGNGNKGWLTDLLSRASREETEPATLRDQPRRDTPRPDFGRNEERQPRHSIESLDSLSVDIARMIDHEAAIDLWDRYKRGERNVFTRRLYTLQGQKAFDEIRTKYRESREFKQTVDRYIAEFEQLLDEVSRDDRGQVVARTYLTSETGKVYTMLAHAAGRFE
ncbi:MAG TPA: apolipoprotein acyltransferase, partial [Pseudolabrys sp.]